MDSEHWAIVGLNGSGKTSLLNMITGYIWASKGEISVLGKQFGKYDIRELRKKIGWVSSSLQEKFYVDLSEFFEIPVDVYWRKDRVWIQI